MPFPGLLAASTFMRWVARSGGPGLILLGLADNSIIPLPGSMDVLTIWLAAHHRTYWWYYAIVATCGAVLGGYLTYGLAKKGGKEAFEKKLSKSKAEQVYRRFERWGFWAVTVPAMLPPPFPIVPFLLAAGALQYSPKNFLASLALGRGIRFFVIAGLGVIYGRQIIKFFERYYTPALITLISFSIIAGIVALLQYKRMRHTHASSVRPQPRSSAA